MKIILTAILLIFSSLLVAQNENTFIVKGKIIDEKNNGIEMVAVRVFNNNKTIRYAITDSLGNFIITKIPKGQYTFEADFLGYSSYKQPITIEKDFILENIVLKNKAESLGEILLKSRKKIIKPTNKGIILNVTGTEMEHKHATIEILELAPNVSLQNGLEILGNKNIKLTVNGQEIPIQYDKVLDYIDKIKPRNIKKIEIIDNSDASFEGEQSAQINIYTKNTTGINGGVNTTVFNNKYWGIKNEAMINYQKNHWQYYVYMYRSNHTSEINNETEQNILDEIYHSILEKHKLDRKEKGFTFSTNYQIDTLKSINFLYDYNLNNDENVVINSLDKITTNQTQDSVIQTDINLDRFYHTHTFSLGYKQILDTLNSHLNLSVSLALTDYKTPEIEQQYFFQNNRLLTYNIYENNKKYSNVISGLKSEWNKNFAHQTELLIGGKLSTVQMDDQIDYFFKDADTNITQLHQFLFRQDIEALYVNYYFKIKKYKFSSGIRNEFTQTYFGKEDVKEYKRDYVRILPNFKISRNINKNYFAYISFARKLNRPSYYQFNPEIIIRNSTERFSGNPDLLPVDIYRFQTGIYYQKKYSINIRHDYQLDNIIYEKTYNTTENYTMIRPVNTGERTNTVIYLSIPVQPYKWWKIYNNITGGYSNFNTDIYPNQDFSSYYFTYSSNNQFNFKKVNVSLNANYKSKNKYLNKTYEPSFTLNCSLNYKANDHWYFQIGVNDVFDSNRSKYQSIYDNLIINTDSRYLSRSARISITYMFSKGKHTQQHQREDILEEEINRSGK